MGLYQNLLFMNTLEDARAWGFVGFKTVAALKKEVDCIPQTKGVYLVLRKEISFPEFAAAVFSRERIPMWILPC